MTPEQFWQQADHVKRMTMDKAEAWMEPLRAAPLETVRKVMLQYRVFTTHYIDDLALLVSRLPLGDLRSFLGQVLSEELGEGSHARSHPYLYDTFLDSLGVEGFADPACELSANRTLLRELTGELAMRSVGFGVGLRGMGGECLCQTYLVQLWESFRDNPHVRELAPAIDWRFWEIHTGEVDTAHVVATRKLIDDYVHEHPDQIPDLARGYERSIGAWDSFWENVFLANPMPRARKAAVA